MTAVGGRPWVCVHMKKTTLEKLHSPARKLQDWRPQGPKGWSILDLTISIRGNLFICEFVPYLEYSECAYFLCNWLTYYSLAEDLGSIFLREISKMKNEHSFSLCLLKRSHPPIQCKAITICFLWSNYKWNKLLIPLSIILRSWHENASANSSRVLIFCHVFNTTYRGKVICLCRNKFHSEVFTWQRLIRVFYQYSASFPNLLLQPILGNQEEVYLAAS